MKRIVNHLSKKWIEYALEFITIIISVLAAFWLTNWGETRQEKKLELFYIQELIQNLTLDEKHLGEVIQDQKGRRGVLETLLQIMPKADVKNKPFIDSLFSSTQGNPTFFPTVGAYKAIISEGTLNLISNKELVTALVELYEFYYVRSIYLGNILDDEVERVTWERRKFYSLYKSEFHSIDAIRHKEVLALEEHHHAFIGLYLGHAQKTFEKIDEVRATLEKELNRLQ